MLTINNKVPDFAVKGVGPEGIQDFSAESLKGKWTILFFYPEDFSFICPTEVTGFNEHLEEAKELGAQILGVSVDSIDLHRDWIEELKIDYPLLSDEGGKMAESFGVLDPQDGRAHRATFIISPDCRIEFVMTTAKNVGRSVHETMRVLRAIHTGNLCPADYDHMRER